MFEDRVVLEDGREARVVTRVLPDQGNVRYPLLETSIRVGEATKKQEGYYASMTPDREHERWVWWVEDGGLGMKGRSADQWTPLIRLLNEQYGCAERYERRNEDES